MATREWAGIRNKSFTLPGIFGGELIISETSDRVAIEVTVRLNGHALSVRLNAKQFEALCAADSAYDGLEILIAPKPERPNVPEPEEDRDAIPA